MALKEPTPRGSKYNPKENNIDYSLTSPLGPDRPFPCGGKKKGPSVKTYKAGQMMTVQFDGTASHNGGHCQFALSKDDVKFVVFAKILDRCPTLQSEQIKLPDNVPSGAYTFAWTWINRTGNREFYMNCADITVDGVKGGRFKGKELLVVNLPGKKTIPEFTNSEDKEGKTLLDQRQDMELESDNSFVLKRSYETEDPTKRLLPSLTSRINPETVSATPTQPEASLISSPAIASDPAVVSDPNPAQNATTSSTETAAEAGTASSDGPDNADLASNSTANATGTNSTIAQTQVDGATNETAAQPAVEGAVNEASSTPRVSIA